MTAILGGLMLPRVLARNAPLASIIGSGFSSSAPMHSYGDRW